MDEEKDMDWGEDPSPCEKECAEADAQITRDGNNRYHVPKHVARAKRKAAKVSRRKNRK